MELRFADADVGGFWHARKLPEKTAAWQAGILSATGPFSVARFAYSLLGLIPLTWRGNSTFLLLRSRFS